MRPPASAVWQQWRWPIVLALLTVFGLLAALMGEGSIWWPLAWAALAVPLLVIVYYVVAPRQRAAPRKPPDRAPTE